MKENDVKEIIQCLPQGRTLFGYFRDRYAAMLLDWAVGDGVTVAELKRGRFAGLLHKPAIKELLAGCGNGVLDARSFAVLWAEPSEQFLLTLDSWGGEHRSWQQTSRAGHNLVLQVNLHDGYRQAFDRCVPDEQRWRFNWYGHPVMQRRADGFYRQTLGWVRMDVDLTTGELLIEEIQTDCVRELRTMLQLCNGVEEPQAQLLAAFCRGVLQRVGKLWDELLLSAALWFSREELGIHKVWYHTADSGSELKRIKEDLPPRSVYTTLPRRFCFNTTQEQPEFLLADKSYRRAVRGKPLPQWFHLEL